MLVDFRTIVDPRDINFSFYVGSLDYAVSYVGAQLLAGESLVIATTNHASISPLRPCSTHFIYSPVVLPEATYCGSMGGITQVCDARRMIANGTK